ncbi:Pectin lyase fold/virulence factor [Pseudocohnilembus persalinus]|uniref:Pectin lyase fold/virulence factor n=1 Tax=Pseudocohnilembus persalinus TaxID=266149 RepID=A0A0V0R8C8_PSEPJ|nr:Pectin lyase fold/virulence factor [Pseudocohnilembus persalinus]|eukprot:KRX10501.1 Pectin lyase fold/virulence factor [Pseudocohnilembus persalinus]
MLVQSNNFTCEYSKFNNNTVEYGYGGAIRVDRENTLIKIKNSDFNFNSGMYGGALSFNTEQDTTLVQNCTFYNNTAQYQGGAIYQDYALSSIEDSDFTNNYSFQGGCIYINFSKKAKLLNLKMQNNSARQANSIYAKESNNLQFIKIQISGQISYRLSNIFLQQIDNVYIQDSNFMDNSCQRNGGVIRIENCGIVDIQESNFKNNTAGYLSDDDSSYTGGAIYIIETEKFSLNNVVFQDNSATYKGGAVSLSQISDFQIDFSEFYNNYVSFDRTQERKDKIGDYNLSKGGSIYYETLFSDLEENQELTFSIQISDCKFQNNSASSGSSVYIHQNITDKNYQINFPKMQNIVIKEDVTDVGLFRILSEETYNQNLFNGIQNEDSIIYVGTDIVQQGYSFNEKSSLNDKLQFSLCPSGTYLAEGGKVACNICQDHGQCDGGYGYYYPDDGYWRLTSTSTQYVYCENAPENCLKNDTCSEGFNGVLCEQCDYNNGYFESVGGGCTECPSQFVSITYIVLAFLIFLAVLALTVFVLQEKVRQVNYKKEIYIIWKKNIIHENNSTSIAKIGIMHIQIIYLLNPTNIEFPNAFSGLAKYFSNPGNTVSVSFYCVNQVLASMFTQSKIFQFFSYSQVISVGILISLFLTILLYNRKALKRKINTVKYQLVCVFIIWFIYQQAGILESCIQFLVCRQIGDIKYSLADINLECDSSYYQKYVQPINIVILLLFLIIIPILMFYKMYRSRHSNYTIKNQCSYGYLYIDLKNELYYWEYLSMFQVNRFQLISSISLVCVIFSSIIMKYQDTDSQLSEQLIKIFCQVITFGTNFLFFIYGVYIYYPNIKYKILAYSLTYFKKCSGNYLKNYFEKQQKIQNNWKILKDNFRNFQKVMKNEKYKNLNRAFLFYNINQQDIMEGIKKGDYKKLNEKVFESYESRIFSQNSVQLKKAKNYVDMLKSMNSLNNINQVQSNRSIKTILQLSRQHDNYSIAVLEEELKSGESNNDRQRQYSSGNEKSSNDSDEIQSRKKIDNYSNKKLSKQNSIQKINNSQDSDIYIPQETNKQMMFDDLDQKWLQFKSQRSYDQQHYIQQQNQQQMNKQYLETSDFIKQNITQGDIETYRQRNKFTVQSEPFENIFSNPSDRNYRRKNTINNQNTTENIIHLLSLDSGSNLQEKIRKNHIYLDNQIIENSEELQNMNKLSSKNSKTHQNQALPFTIKQSDKNTHEISIDNKIEANELESQDYKNINKIDAKNNIEDSDKKENNQKNRLIPENSSKQQQNLKGSILSQSQIPSKNSSSQESSKQIPSEKISYFTDSYQNEIMGDFDSKEQNTNEQSNTKDNSCRPVTQKQESDTSKENTNKNDNNNKS